MDPQREAMFYHALNMLVRGDRRVLLNVASRGKGWERAWHAQAAHMRPDPEQEWAALAQRDIRIVLATDNNFPSLLREIPHPPLALYYRGDAAAIGAEMKTPAVAIVGTRTADGPGKALAKKFAAGLARGGAVVVSGLAYGIDAAAHVGTLESGGRTVAVLAGGLDQIYPSAHEYLAADILKRGGALASEYPPGEPALPRRFLERNRIVSGLTRAVVIVEAPEHSGVMTTARYALEQNREIYVAPGSAGDPHFTGSHRLIRSGATLVETTADLLSDLGLEINAHSVEIAFDTPEEARIFSAIRNAGQPLNIDEIIAAATLTTSVVNRTLAMLVLKSAIWEEGGRYGICDSS